MLDDRRPLSGTETIYKCLTYFKMIVKSREQLMGVQLPARVRLEKLFILMRIDYFVTITIKCKGGRGAKTTNACVVIFVCMATISFYLELT